MKTRIACNPTTLLAFWRTQLGYSENPRGSNRTKYGAWYGMNGVAWCAIGDSYMSYFSGNPLPAIRTSKGYSYVPDLQNYARDTGQWKPKSSGYTPKPGDRVLFSFGGERVDHVATLNAYLGNGRHNTFEGNTNAAGSRTGGSVLEKIRTSNIVGYVAVDYIGGGGIDFAALRRLLAAKLREQYGACPNMTIGHPACCEVVALQQSLNLVGDLKPQIATDGVYGDQTAIAVANFQKYMNALGANIQDFPGAALEGTRWWLCVCLQNIRDGK